ncbi:MAG: hypothetical protein ACFFAO_02655 [Candidatus Hermodarchaeota archaeon]
MDEKEKNLSLEKLTRILSTIQDLYYKKNEQIEELQSEINDLKQIIDYLNSIVSNKSFHSADELYRKEIMEDYLNEEVSSELTQGTELKRKIFSKDNKELLGVLKFIDNNKIEIKVLEPELRNIEESSEEFVNLFLRGALVPIKEKIPDLQLKYEYFKKTNFIEKITINNIKSIDDFDLISDKITQLLLSTC